MQPHTLLFIFTTVKTRLYGCSARLEPMEEGKSAVEHLRMIFDLCDRDRDGVITAEDFRLIGQQHFGKTQQIETLIQRMDPTQSGHITFDTFRLGIEAYLVEYQRLNSSSSSISLSSNSSAEEWYYDCAFSGADVYPVSHNLFSSSYDSEQHSASNSTTELIGESEERQTGRTLSNGPLSQSTPAISVSSQATAVTSSRDSPNLMARQLIRRHNQLALPDTPSQSSTPAEQAEEEVSKLSDQLQELSMKLEDLQEDHKDSQGFGLKLKKENTELRSKLVEYEDLLRESEQTNQQLLNESQDRLRMTVAKMRQESEHHLEDIRHQLKKSTEQLDKVRDSESTLRTQLQYFQEECSSKEDTIVDLEEGKREVEEELKRAREELRLEREKWKMEREEYRQGLHERDHQLQQLREECKEVQMAKKMNSITASDMSREIDRMRKELEQLQHENEDLQMQFFQQGKELISRNKQSLAAEMENASKEEVVKVLKETEDHNSRLRTYIDGLLVVIMEKNPDILEKRS